MKNMLLTSSQLLSLLLLVSLLSFRCGFDKTCLEPEGESVTVRKNLEPFRYLRSALSAQVIYRQSDEFYVEWTGPANYLDAVKFEVSREYLDIRSEDCFKRSGEVQIVIGTRELIEITLDGAGSFTGESHLGSPEHFAATLNGVGGISGEVQTESVSASVNGAGNIKLSGKAKTAKASIHGAGNFIAYELQTEHSYIEIAGSGSAQISASNTLDVNIAGAGSVTYQGDPEVTRQVAGVGTVRQRNQ